MRISDWSSDVCSSDLCTETKKFRLRAIAGPAETPAHLLAHDQNRTSRTRTLKAHTTIKPKASSSMHPKQVQQPGYRRAYSFHLLKTTDGGITRHMSTASLAEIGYDT